MSATEPVARHELIATALSLGIERPDELSNQELSDAIRAASEAGEVEPAPPGWFAVARHLVESVVEQGLNLPNAAKMLRAVGGRMWAPAQRQRPPLPTVTLAQIYLSQGHKEKAHATLTQVLARQPENAKARKLLEELEATSGAEAVPATESDAVARETPAGDPVAREGEVTEAVASEAVASEPAAGEPVASAGAAPGDGLGDRLGDGLGDGLGDTATANVEMSEAAPSQSAAQVAASSPLQSAEDVVVVVASADGVRVCWELGGRAAQLAPDQGVELLVRVFRPSAAGPLVREQRHALSTLTGVRGVSVEERSFVRAALVDVQDGAAVLGVAPVYRALGPGSLELDSFSFTSGAAHGDESARSLALRWLSV